MDYSSYNYIVAIPYGATVKDKTMQLTLPSQLVIKAALSLYTKGKKILLCGEESFDTPLYKEPVTTHLMKEFLLSHKVPEKDIISVGNKNKNTVQQIEAVAGFQKKQNLTSLPFLLLCLPYHKKRIEIHAKAYGLNAEVVPINKIDSTIVTKEVGDLFSEDFEPTEKISRILSTIDRKGHYSNFFTLFQGTRIVDVVDGKAKLILGRKMRKNLERDAESSSARH